MGTYLGIYKNDEIYVQQINYDIRSYDLKRVICYFN